jgi:dehydrogenase/reductase SDR family protein 12
MTRILVDRSLQIRRSPREVFLYLRDFSTAEQWDPGVARAEKTTPGAAAPGSRFALALNVLGRRVPMDYTLLDAIAPTQLRLRGSSDGFTVDDTIDLVPDGTGTRLRYQATMDLRGVPAALRPLAQAWCGRIGDVAMRGLAAALDDDGPLPVTAAIRLGERLMLPAAADFTARGYRRMPSRGLSRRVDGRVFVTTGATGGLGLACAQELARLGGELILVGRGAARLQAAADAIQAFAGPTTIHRYEAELSLIGECRRVGAEIVAAHPRLDGLINNAGALPASRIETAEGFELALAINLLAPYLLTEALRPALQAASGRVVNVVSGGLYLQPLRLDDLGYRKRRYDGAQAYAQAKRALLTLTRHWAADPRYAGITLQAMHPGWAATPGVASSLPAFNRTLGPWLRDARMGADTMVWLATHPALSDPAHNGGFWFDRRPRPDAVLPGTAVDDQTRRRLIDWLAAVGGT